MQVVQQLEIQVSSPTTRRWNKPDRSPIVPSERRSPRGGGGAGRNFIFQKLFERRKSLNGGRLNSSRQAGPAEFNKASKQRNPRALQPKPL